MKGLALPTYMSQQIEIEIEIEIEIVDNDSQQMEHALFANKTVIVVCFLLANNK